MRNHRKVSRGEALTIFVDGRAVQTFQGETIAAAMLADDLTAFRLDRSGRARGLFCNMGVCCECLVEVAGRRVRACVTPVAEGVSITTGAGPEA